MIGKIRKGRSFGGCIRYVTQKDDAKIIEQQLIRHSHIYFPILFGHGQFIRAKSK